MSQTTNSGPEHLQMQRAFFSGACFPRSHTLLHGGCEEFYLHQENNE